jgi:hypothetical protein
MSLEEAPETTIPKGPITLNIGGTKFTTTISTLTSQPDTFFTAMFSGNFPIITESDGSIFIDRSPKYFEYILDYLRSNKYVTEELTKKELQKILVEAEYYQLSDLVKIVTSKLSRYRHINLYITTGYDLTDPKDDVYIVLANNNFKLITMTTKNGLKDYHYISKERTTDWSISQYVKATMEKYSKMKMTYTEDNIE